MIEFYSERRIENNLVLTFLCRERNENKYLSGKNGDWEILQNSVTVCTILVDSEKRISFNKNIR